MRCHFSPAVNTACGLICLYTIISATDNPVRWLRHTLQMQGCRCQQEFTGQTVDHREQ